MNAPVLPMPFLKTFIKLIASQKILLSYNKTNYGNIFDKSKGIFLICAIYKVNYNKKRFTVIVLNKYKKHALLLIYLDNIQNFFFILWQIQVYVRSNFSVNLPTMHYDRLQQTTLLLIKAMDFRDEAQYVLDIIRKPAGRIKEYSFGIV